MSSIKEMAKDFIPYLYSPTAAMSKVFNVAMDAKGESPVEILDPNNPVVFTIENAIMCAHASVEHHENTLRYIYPVMATTYEELYPHMADVDFIDRFAQPVTTTFNIMVGLNELKSKAVPPDSNLIRKLVIPRDTSITISGITFTMQYDVELCVLPHGGVKVVYNTKDMSPVRVLASNALKWGITTIPYNGTPIEMLVFEVPMMQYLLTSITDNVLPGISFRNRYAYTDKFYYGRVWIRKAGGWSEIKTTHSERVINPLEPTAQFKVSEDNLVEVHIPDVYITAGMVTGDIRIDIYTTKGELTFDMSQWTQDEFTYQLRDVGKVLQERYYAPLRSFTNIKMWSSAIAEGGRPELPFLALRDRVIDNSVGSRIVPLSDLQLSNRCKDMGYDISKSIDYVTRRIYKASREMLPSTIEEVSAPIGTVNGTLDTSREELALLESVRENGNRITVTPDTLYRYTNGTLDLSPMSILQFNKLPINQRVALANNGTYLFTPFHYVLDYNNDLLDMRPYYLSTQYLDGKQFHETNITLNLEVGVGDYSIEETEYGYRILIVTRSGDTYRALDDSQVHVQLSYLPRGYSQDYAYVNGTLLGWDNELDERIYEFKLHTNLDIDRNHDMILNNFTLIGNRPTNIAVRLEQRMQVLFGVTNYNPPEFKLTNIDKVYQSDLRGLKGITHESINVNLGHSAEGLWSNARYIAGQMNYARYAEDVLKFWPMDVNARDADGIPRFTISQVGGKDVLTWIYEHRKGEPVIGPDGKQEILHHKGQVIKQPDGRPVIDSPRTIRQRLDLFLLDAKYRFSDAPATKHYLSRVVTSLRDSIVDDVSAMGELLEQSDIYLFPRTTLGDIKVLLADGTTTTLDAEQRFEYSFYLSAAARRNDDLLRALKTTARSVSENMLSKNEVSCTEMTKTIKTLMGGEIIDVSMTPLGVDQDQPIFTIYDSTDRATISKKLVIEPDFTISIRDDIVISFNRHQIEK